MISTLTVHCQWIDEMTRDRTGHPFSYAEAKKMKSLTIHTHGCPRACLRDCSSSSSIDNRICGLVLVPFHLYRHLQLFPLLILVIFVFFMLIFISYSAEILFSSSIIFSTKPPLAVCQHSLSSANP